MTSGGEVAGCEQLPELIQNANRAFNETEVDAFKRCLQHDDPVVREQAMLGLSLAVDTQPDTVQSVIPELIELLSDEDGWVRGRAAVTVGKLDAAFPDRVSEAIPKIVAIVSEDRYVVRSITLANAAYAIEVLAANHAGELEHAVAPLGELCADNRPPITYNATAALCALADSDPTLITPALERIASRVADDRSATRIHAIRALAYAARAHDYQVVNAIEAATVIVEFADHFEALTSEDAELLQGGLDILSEFVHDYPISIEPTIDTVIECLNDNATREKAETILFEVADTNPDVLPLLSGISPLLSDEDSAVREIASGLLRTAVRNSLTEVRDVLLELLDCTDDPSAEVRQNVLVVLRRLPTETYTQYEPALPNFVDIITTQTEKRMTRESASIICHEMGNQHASWFNSHADPLLGFLQDDISPATDPVGATVTTYALVPLTQQHAQTFDPFIPTIEDYFRESSTGYEVREAAAHSAVKRSMLFLWLLTRLAQHGEDVTVELDFDSHIDFVSIVLDPEYSHWHLESSSWRERMRIHTVRIANLLTGIVADPVPLVDPLISIVRRNDGYVDEYCEACKAIANITPPPETAVEPLKRLREYRSEERVKRCASEAIDGITDQTPST